MVKFCMILLRGRGDYENYRVILSHLIFHVLDAISSSFSWSRVLQIHLDSDEVQVLIIYEQQSSQFGPINTILFHHSTAIEGML